MMKKAFSFKYDEKPFNPECNKAYEIESGITITPEVKEYKEYDAAEWVLYFENKSDKNSGIFSDILDCDTLLPLELPEVKRPGYMTKEGDACVITMTGPVAGTVYCENDKVSATEFGFNYEYLDKVPDNTKSFCNIGGRSSDGMMPFFDVTASGSGYIVAIGWTGDWKAEFSKKDNGIYVKTGLKETGFYLKPEEKIRTTSVLIMQYNSDEDKYNKFRRLIKEHFSHKACTSATRDGLMAFELWGGLTSEEMKKRITELKNHNVKLEDIWIDAGWYGNCTKCDDAFSGDWGQHTGEWEVNKRVHPQELKDVADCAKEAGMKLMLWFEPERVITGTKIVDEHPDWFLSNPSQDWCYILNYGNDDALAYICNLIADYILKLDLSCYRQDFNIEISEYFRFNDEEDRRGITEIKHIMGMYKMWDYILEKFPGLIIDNCSSGGRRIDIETLKRSIPFFRSDYQCNFNETPEVLQTHNNLSHYLPYNGCTSKTKNDTYAIRSSYSSSWGGAFYNAIFQSMDEDDFSWAKKVTDEYRRIRKYMSCDFYNHGSVVFDDTAWAIWQYHDQYTDGGVVMAFRRSKSPFDRVTIKLKGLLDQKEYTYTNLDDGSCFGGTNSLEIVLPQQRSCTVFEYKAK